MFSNRLTVAVVAAGCVTAAGVGGYVATRQNLGEVAAPAVTAAPIPAIAAPAVGEGRLVAKPVDVPPAAQPDAQPRMLSQSTPSLPDAPPNQPPTPPAATVAVANTRAPELAPVRERPAPPAAIQSASPAPEPPVAAPPPAEEARPVVETASVQDPPGRAVEELVVQPDSVIGLETETSLTSERARVEDRVDARVVRDVRVNGAIAIPAGSRALGTVVVVDRGGKLRERARIGIRFQTLVLSDGTRLPVSTETIYRYGEPPGDRGAAKIAGGAVAGAILGAIINGGKGAAIGAAAGAGAGTTAVMSGERSAAVFPAGAEVTARILAPVTVTIEK